MAGGNNVIIAMDEDEHTLSALKFYMKHLHRPDHNLILFHAIELGDPKSARDMFLTQSVLADEYGEDMEKAKKLEKKFIEVLNDYKLPAAPRVRIEGGRKAEHAIVQVAKEEHAMLVVVGCRGRGGLARAILGSTSDYVVHHAHCPVIVARV